MELDVRNIKNLELKFGDTSIISNLDKDQVGLIRGEDQQRQATITKRVRQGCSLSLFLFNRYVC